MSFEKASSARRQEFLYNQIRDELIRKIEALGAKVDHAEPVITKNPVSEDWHVIEGDLRDWTLFDLKKELGLQDEKAPAISDDRCAGYKKQRSIEAARKIYADAGKHFRVDYAQAGRVCMLFESIRGLAYAEKAHCSNEDQLRAWVLAECEEFDRNNNTHDRMPPSDIRAVSKSISRWTWKNYRSSDDKDRGVCAREGLINAGMTPTTRKAVGGAYGAKKKALNAQERIVSIYEQWTSEGKDITVSALAKTLKMDRKTVRKYLPKEDVSATSQDLLGGGDYSVYKGEAQPRSSPETHEVEKRDIYRDEPTPDLTAIRDGETWSFWLDPQNPDILIDKEGHSVPRVYVNSYIVYEKPLEPVPIPDCLL